MNRASSYVRDSWTLARIREERRSVVGLIVLFWIGFQIVYYYTHVLLADQLRDYSLSQLIVGVAEFMVRPLELSVVGVGALLCLLIYLVLRKARGLPFWGRMLSAAYASTLGAILFSLTVSILCELFGTEWPELTISFFITDVLRWLPAFGLWAGIALTITYNFEMHDRERQLATARAQAQEAQMRALRYQVNPHFLYNALNAIAALILDRENELAEEMVMRLSDFFRAGLSMEPHLDVPLIEEIATQQLYLSIEQMRFGERFTFDLKVAPDTEQIMVPSFILQPIMENALKHGVHLDGRSTRLTLKTGRAEDRLVIDISDDGPGQSSIAGTGIGLRNVMDRLRSRYGDKANLVASSQPNGFGVRISVPV